MRNGMWTSLVTHKRFAFYFLEEKEEDTVICRVTDTNKVTVDLREEKRKKKSRVHKKQIAGDLDQRNLSPVESS